MAAAAKSLQSCPTLCDPIDGSPPASPGILQARTLEWVAISFSNAWEWKVKVKSLCRVWLLATPWTAAYQAPLPMGFSRQEYWSGLPLPSPYTVEVTNRLKGLDLVNRVPEELWTEVYNTVQEAVNKTIPKKKKCKKAKWLSEEALQIAEERKEVEKPGRKGKIYPTECRVPENSKERQDGVLQWTMQRNRGKQQIGKD